MRDRELDHAEAVRSGSELPRTLVRRCRGGHEPDFVQPDPLANLLRGAEVPEMDRVEGPPEDPDASRLPHSRI